MSGRTTGAPRDYDLFYWMVAFAAAVAWVTLYALCVAILFHVHLLL
ncbi:conserved hypothetical protein [Gluconacetobacter diazotrophicus PA1 5]|nr:hypothetical protein [Gluconacetobacter diazotrophicus]ACI52497.1 conserved hypothetical protein [Gluconacetobacter diazotrophicus PA1 5]TWB03108.1 hypothetical protein FBZ86_12219 [Gluconacetobacter diazotrophicus]